MKDRILVTVLVLVTAAYAWGLGWIAWGFVRAGSALGYGMALGIAILLVLTVWVTWREVLFGLSAGRLAGRYEPPPGAIDGDPREEFEAARTALEDGAGSEWRAWFRLALAYDALRDRKGARMATRRAIDAARG
ncbi:hypothetical protein ACT3SP_07475 [Brachybacterium sp. AOP43-C2-M15]|uniref:hypothetical protein n=1 Tax=Brachybacterium sp. AOP43-C2-M15 TaxID=3457661 RepID=UPI004033EF7C